MTDTDMSPRLRLMESNNFSKLKNFSKDFLAMFSLWWLGVDFFAKNRRKKLGCQYCFPFFFFLALGLELFEWFFLFEARVVAVDWESSQRFFFLFCWQYCYTSGTVARIVVYRESRSDIFQKKKPLYSDVFIIVLLY